jgi:hypothetical protein
VVNEQHTAGDKQLLTQQQSDSDGEVHPGIFCNQYWVIKYNTRVY